MHSKISKKAVRSLPIFGPLIIFLLIVAEDSHMLRERINIFQPTDGLDAHTAVPIPSFVHPHAFVRRPRAQAKNRFEHTVLSFELICMTLSARADSVPVSEGAVERRTMMLLSVKRRSPLPDIKMFVSSFCVTLRFARDRSHNNGLASLFKHNPKEGNGKNRALTADPRFGV